MCNTDHLCFCHFVFLKLHRIMVQQREKNSKVKVQSERAIKEALQMTEPIPETKCEMPTIEPLYQLDNARVDEESRARLLDQLVDGEINPRELADRVNDIIVMQNLVRIAMRKFEYTDVDKFRKEMLKGKHVMHSALVPIFNTYYKFLRRYRDRLSYMTMAVFRSLLARLEVLRVTGARQVEDAKTVWSVRVDGKLFGLPTMFHTGKHCVTGSVADRLETQHQARLSVEAEAEKKGSYVWGDLAPRETVGLVIYSWIWREPRDVPIKMAELGGMMTGGTLSSKKRYNLVIPCHSQQMTEVLMCLRDECWGCWRDTDTEPEPHAEEEEEDEEEAPYRGKGKGKGKGKASGTGRSGGLVKPSGAGSLGGGVEKPSGAGPSSSSGLVAKVQVMTVPYNRTPINARIASEDATILMQGSMHLVILHINRGGTYTFRLEDYVDVPALVNRQKKIKKADEMDYDYSMTISAGLSRLSRSR